MEGTKVTGINGVIKQDNVNDLQKKIMNKEVFNFRLLINKKKFLRNGILLLFLSAFLGAGLGTLIDLIFIKVVITDEYARLGVGSGMGALAGLVIGLLLLIPLKRGFVEDYGISYGAGIGTNILIGAIIGILFGAIFGSLFGLILEALDFGLGMSTLSYPVFGILIWITLGLNIGVLIGVIASFGLAGIVFGGILSGGLVGVIGMFATFGISYFPAIGAGTGIIAGGLIGFLMKFSINASIGKPDNISAFGWLRPGRERARGKSTDDCCASGDCGSSNWDCNCGSSDCGGGGDCGGVFAAIGLIILFGVAIILVILLINIIAWLSTKASIKFGETVKRGALTAIGASFSIFLIIGTNIGLTESFHNVLFRYNLFIGAGIGLIFGILIFIAQGLSIRISQIKITPSSITWKDRHTSGSYALGNIEGFEFLKEQRNKDTPFACYEDYFQFITQDGNMHKIVINCWKTPDGTNSTDYIQTILQQYIGQNKITDEQKLEEYYDKLQKSETAEEVTIKDTKYSISGYSFSTSSEITDEMVAHVENLIAGAKKVSIYWLHNVTQYPERIIEEIVTIHLGYRIENGFVKK